MDLRDTSKIQKFCQALDAEIACRSSHAAASTRPPLCESCPLSLAMDVSRQLQLQPDKNLYDAVRVAVRKSIPEKAARELLYGVLRTKIEEKT